MRYDSLWIFRQSPYQGALAKDGLEAALAAGAFEQNLAILYESDGVWQLVQEQSAQLIERKSHYKMTQALTLFGVDALFVRQSALIDRNILPEQLMPGVQCLDASGCKALLSQARHLVCF
jgi:tRNA 2-thiouridine synthesizing protein C